MTTSASPSPSPLPLHDSQLQLSEDVRVKIRRIYRLTEKPHNSNFAYQHLEHIRALSASVLEALGESPEPETAASTKPAYAEPPTDFSMRHAMLQAEQQGLVRE